MLKCLASAKGVIGKLHFPLPSINRRNQNEPATFFNFVICILLRIPFFCTMIKLLNTP
jgi:1-acyl-sn-glycerol-3-phosphate acyltransferase